jgi:hypothetical protein
VGNNWSHRGDNDTITKMIYIEAGEYKITEAAMMLPESKKIIKDENSQVYLAYVYNVYSPQSPYANVLYSRRRAEIHAKFVRVGTWQDLEETLKEFIDSYVSKSIPYYQQFYEAWKKEVDDFLVKIHEISFLDSENNLDFKKKAEALKYADQLLSLGQKYEKVMNAEKKKIGSFSSMMDSGEFL